MSEHYDFHYQPTGSGAISGQQVLQQTEDAINELGDYVNDNVGGAMDVAQQALETAQNAEQDAQTALDTANSFSSAIQSAQQDASTALSTAQTAQTTASNANNTAIQAQQDASNAVTTANNASGQVSTLSGTVTALGQRVTTAEGNIGQNTSDITALTTRVGTAEGNITTLQNDVTIAQGNASSAMATAGTVKQQAYVFRYSSTALVASSTNSNTLLDNTDNLKVGDKVIDSSGVLFSITAIDSVNSTFTVGSALVDLALDANVVHTSGVEDIIGSKRFGVSQSFTGYPSIRLYSPNDDVNVLPSAHEQREIRFTDKNNVVISYFIFQHRTDANEPFRTCWRQGRLDGTLNYYSVNFNNLGEFYPENNNAIKLGTSTNRWSEVYATNYYYGSSNVEFSTKFVTTDTNQTITGAKTFLDVPITFKSSTAELGVTGGSTNVTFLDKNGKNLSGLALGNYGSSKLSYVRLSIFDKDVNDNEIQDVLEYSYVSNNANAYLRVYRDNFCTLGSTSYRWKGVYAQSYYYGSNNVEFSTKFVTTDTNQTVDGSKTFSDNLTIYNSDDTQTPKGLTIRNAQWGMGESGGTTFSSIKFLDKNSAMPVSITASKGSSGQSFLRFSIRTKDSQNNSLTEEIYYDIDTSGNVEFRSWHDNVISLGTSAYKWKDVQTNMVNGLTPSSLSLPSGNANANDVIDISSYLVNLDGTTNSYTVPANGWISIAITGTAISIVSSSWSDSRLRASSGDVRMLYPVLKNETLDISVTGTTLAYARFIPCQGNV